MRFDVNRSHDRRGFITPLVLMLLVVIAMSATATFRAFAHGERGQRQAVLKSQLSAIEASANAWVHASGASLENEATIRFAAVDPMEVWESVISKVDDDSVSIVSRITVDGKVVGTSQTSVAFSESKARGTSGDDVTEDDDTNDAAPEERQETSTASENEDSE